MATAQIESVPLARIQANIDQPRKIFDPIKHQGLALSIERAGLQQPIVLRPVKGGMLEIVAGERRWRAVCWLFEQGRIKQPRINAIVRRQSVDERDIAALIENIQRDDLTPLEEAMAFQRELDKGRTVEELADLLGITQPWRITYRTQLLKMSEVTRAIFVSGGISANAAYELAKLSHEEQTQILKRISSGAVKGDSAIKGAVAALLDKSAQGGMFGKDDDKEGKSEENLKVLKGMEATIEKMVALVNKGWKEGECTIATQVDPDRAAHLAQRIAFIRKTLGSMERELQEAHGARHMALAV